MDHLLWLYEMRVTKQVNRELNKQIFYYGKPWVLLLGSIKEALCEVKDAPDGCKLDPQTFTLMIGVCMRCCVEDSRTT